MLCPCHSGLLYEECCQSYHVGGALPENALKLMRSRYSAYALSLVDYIIETTHLEHPSYSENLIPWRRSILDFCHQTSFEGLEIISFLDGKKEAFVTFFAQLKQGDKDVSFQEKSRFLKIESHWQYHSGEHLS